MKYGKQYVEYEAYLMVTVQNFDNFYCNIIIVNVYDFVLLGNKKQEKPKAMWQLKAFVHNALFYISNIMREVYFDSK